MSSMEEHYLQLQKVCGLSVGDTVKVLRAPKQNELGWGDIYGHPESVHTRMVGQECEITDFDWDADGYLVRSSDGDTAWLPFFVLQKVGKPVPPPKESYRVLSATCGIKVGDTVKVLGEITILGCSTAWNTRRREYIGKIGLVTADVSNGDFYVHVSGFSRGSVGVAIPFVALEKVQPKASDHYRMNNGHKARFLKTGGIHFGCQSWARREVEKFISEYRAATSA